MQRIRLGEYVKIVPGRENCSPEKFCRDYYACPPGIKFAMKYKTMRECYDALLRGEAGEISLNWAAWVLTRPGLLDGRGAQLFAFKCARVVEHIASAADISGALDVSERFANGTATADEMGDTEIAFGRAVSAILGVWFTVKNFPFDAFVNIWDAINRLDPVGREKGRAALMSVVAEFGNPFAEDEK